MKLALFISLFTLFSCAHSRLEDRSYMVGNTLKTYRYSNLYFSRQPVSGEYDDLKEEGITTVISLREKSEHDENKEKSKLKSLGIDYKNIPFSMKNKLTDEYVTKVTKSVVKARSKGKVLVHCSSGNRVGIWLGAHFYKDHDYTKKNALIIAEELGLNKQEAIDKLNDYFKEH